MGKTRLIQFLNFNLAWWGVALAAAHDCAWYSLFILPVAAFIHLYQTPNRRGEITFYFLAAAIGFLLDGALINLGLFRLSSGESLAPPWLVAMWVLLAFTMDGLKSFRHRPWLLFLVGGITGPLTYIWCEGLHLLNYQNPWELTLLMHATLWGLLTPWLLRAREWVFGLYSAPDGSMVDWPKHRLEPPIDRAPPPVRPAVEPTPLYRSPVVPSEH